MLIYTWLGRASTCTISFGRLDAELAGVLVRVEQVQQSGYCLPRCFRPFIPRQVRWRSVGCLFCWPACLLALLLRQQTDKWLRCLFVLIKKLAHKGEKLCSLSALKLQENSGFGVTAAGESTREITIRVQCAHLNDHNLQNQPTRCNFSIVNPQIYLYEFSFA